MNAWTDLLHDRIVDAASARAHLAGAGPHYVYVLCRADSTPFYVGKGVQLRCFHHEAEARNTERLTHKLNLLWAMHRRGEAVGYCVESDFQTEVEAHARERFLIMKFGRHDQGRGPLTNQTDGGEGASNPSPESRERRRQSLWGEAEDEERRAANRWFQTLCEVKSVPIKPLSRFKPERLHANRTEFAMSSRHAAALAASAVANHVVVEAGAIIPRLLHAEGVAMAIENGVGRDILSSGMALIADGTVGAETLSLTLSGYRFIVSTMGRRLLEPLESYHRCWVRDDVRALTGHADPHRRTLCSRSRDVMKRGRCHRARSYGRRYTDLCLAPDKHICHAGTSVDVSNLSPPPGERLDDRQGLPDFCGMNG